LKSSVITIVNFFLQKITLFVFNIGGSIRTDSAKHWTWDIT